MAKHSCIALCADSRCVFTHRAIRCYPRCVWFRGEGGGGGEFKVIYIREGRQHTLGVEGGGGEAIFKTFFGEYQQRLHRTLKSTKQNETSTPPPRRDITSKASCAHTHRAPSFSTPSSIKRTPPSNRPPLLYPPLSLSKQENENEQESTPALIKLAETAPVEALRPRAPSRSCD